jgi:hypothetical protein
MSPARAGERAGGVTFAPQFRLRLRFDPRSIRGSTVIASNTIVVRRTMRGFQNNSFDPQTLVVLETAFDEAWLTLKAIGNTTVRPDELARSLLRLAMEGERDPVRLHDGALQGLLPATAWREAG